MNKINKMILNSDELAKGLTENGAKHQCYRIYTSMERALGFLLTGDIYVSNGETWNDQNDSELMHTRKKYGVCFSYSTKENIAMWMLYGDKNGKNGAMLRFVPSVRDDILRSKKIILGSFQDDGKYKEVYLLSRNKNDYEIFFTDLIYVDPCKNSKIKITYDKKSVDSDNSILSNNNIFYKNIAWEYEKECRLIVKLSEEWYERAEKEKLSTIKLSLSKKSLNRIRKEGLVRSPTYCGGVENGKPSDLTGSVKWDIKN